MRWSAVAKAYAEVGDTDHAIAALEKFADKGQVDESLLSGENHSFSAIEKSPRYQSILQRFKENKSTVALGESVFTLSDPGLLAEDIDYDPGSKTFLITSVLERKIVRVSSDGKVKDFAISPSHWPMLAIKVDAAHNLVWASEVGLQGFTNVSKADWYVPRYCASSLVLVELVRRLEGPKGAALGDLVLDCGGNADREWWNGRRNLPGQRRSTGAN